LNRRRCRSAGAPLVLRFLLLLALPALAADPPAAATPGKAGRAPCGGNGPANIDVSWVNIDAQQALESAVCDWFRDDPWRVRFSRLSFVPAPRAPETLSIAVELASAERARLHVTVSPEPYWTHDVALSAGLDETGVEIIAQTLHSITDAVVRSAPARARPKPVAGSAARAPDADAGQVTPSPAATDGNDRGGARDKAVAGRGLAAHTGIGFVAFLRGEEPTSYGPASSIAVDWSRQPTTLGSFFRGAPFTSDEKRAAGLEVKSSGAEAGMTRRFGAFELELLALARYQLSHTAYQVRDGQALTTLFESWRLQPGLSIGAGYAW
jgi:hypothetical protein